MNASIAAELQAAIVPRLPFFRLIWC